MERDAERIERVVDALRIGGYDALLCAFPANVLLLTGYWPVIGNSIALVARDGRVGLLVPEDEHELAVSGWPDILHTFSPGSLDDLRPAAAAALGPLSLLVRDLGLVGIGARVAFEGGEVTEPVSYAALHLYGLGIRSLLEQILPRAELVDGTDLIARLRAVKTVREVECIVAACNVAERAFRAGAVHIAANATERVVAADFAASLLAEASCDARSGGFAFCMSGPNSAKAWAAYARSCDRVLEQGEVALVRCNSVLGGFWTDITRSYSTGVPGERELAMYEAVFAARREMLAMLRPGVRAREVDAAARAVLSDRGFGRAFPHGAGHGVGFGATDRSALPRLHPRSPDVLEAGMVFTLAPAVYLEELAGVRHSDMVVVTERGARVLTRFHDSLAELTVD